MNFRSASAFAHQSPSWFWGQRVVRNDVNILAGPQGLGKSQFGVALAAALSNQGTADEPRISLIISGEDDPETTIKPRLMAYDAHLAAVQIMETDSPFKLDEKYLPQLEQAVRDMGAEFVVIDPVAAFVGKGTDAYKDDNVRAVLGQMRSIAQRLDCTFLLVMHTKKGEEHVAANNIAGSIAWTAAPRSVLIMTRDPDGAAAIDRLVFHVKCNVGPEQPPIACHIEGVDADVLGVATSMLVLDEERDGADVLAALGPADKGKPTKLDEAVDFLKATLEHGALPVKDVQGRATLVGISLTGALRRASEQVCDRKKAPEGHWLWELKQGVHL
jgi:hypothetical protein